MTLSTKVSKVRLLTLIWCFAIFTTFISGVKIYPIVFLLFSFLFFALEHKSIKVNYYVLLLILILFSLIQVFFLSGIHGFKSTGFISVKDNFKMFINYLWLISSVLFYQKFQTQIQSNKDILRLTFLIILILSSIQLIYKINALDLWVTPFDGSNVSSSVSTVLNEMPSFFGDLNKNIFATKVLFIFIIYIQMNQVGFFGKKKIKWGLIIWGLVFSVYSLSRTGQAIYLIFIFLLFLKAYFEYPKYRALRPIVVSLIVFMGLIVVRVALNSFFHLDLSSSADGFSTRLILWLGYLKNIGNIGYLGNGVFSAADFIEQTIGRRESNFHNVFMNMSYEAGWIGLGMYFLLLVSIYHIFNFRQLFWISTALFIPFIGCINSHYTGYGPDEVIYMANSFSILHFVKAK